MKRIATLIILICLTVLTVMGQDVDLKLAVATQALTQNMLMEQLGLSEGEAGEILALQEQLRLRKEQTTLELNIIKAQIAQKLYYADANSNEVGRLLEKASELRLGQEKAQVDAYLQIRNELGEENWTKLMQRTREIIRNRELTQNKTGDETRDNSGSRGSSSSSSGSSGSSGSSSQSSQSSGSSSR